MKKLLINLFIGLFGISSAQVTIEKTTPIGTEGPLEAANSSVSLELGNATGGKKGIILPWVTDATSGNLGTNVFTGTLIFDSSTQKVKLSTSNISDTTTNGVIWKDLSLGAKSPTTNYVPDMNIENSSSKVIIGNTNNTNASANGILILSDTNKAMILPRVNSYTDIINPSAGMIVYVTSKDHLAVYNGEEWAFWTRQ